MRGILTALALSTAAIPHHAKADFYDGNDLYGRCIGSTYTEKSTCMGYVVAIWDIGDVDERCSAMTVSAGQIVDVVKVFLRDHPAKRHLPAEALVWRAFETAFCEKRGE